MSSGRLVSGYRGNAGLSPVTMEIGDVLKFHLLKMLKDVMARHGGKKSKFIAAF